MYKTLSWLSQEETVDQDMLKWVYLDSTVDTYSIKFEL